MGLSEVSDCTITANGGVVSRCAAVVLLNEGLTLMNKYSKALVLQLDVRSLRFHFLHYRLF